MIINNKKQGNVLPDDIVYESIVNLIFHKKADNLIYEIIMRWLLKLQKAHPYIYHITNGSIQVHNFNNNNDELKDLVVEIIYELIHTGKYKNLTYSKPCKDTNERNIKHRIGDNKGLQFTLDLSLPPKQVISYVYTFVNLQLHKIIYRLKMGTHSQTIISHIKKHRPRFEKIKEIANNLDDPFIMGQDTISYFKGLGDYTEQEIYLYRISMCSESKGNVEYTDNFEKVVSTENNEYSNIIDQALLHGKLRMEEKFLVGLYHDLHIPINTFEGIKYIRVTKDLLHQVFPELLLLVKVKRTCYNGSRKTTSSIYEPKLVCHTEIYKSGMAKLQEYILNNEECDITYNNLM